MSGKTLYDKLWDAHRVREDRDGTCLIYIDRHLVHEVTSPQAFEGLRLAGRTPWRTGSVLAVPDHNVPTTPRVGGVAGIEDPVSRIQVETLEDVAAPQALVQIAGPDHRPAVSRASWNRQTRSSASRSARGCPNSAHRGPLRFRRKPRQPPAMRRSRRARREYFPAITC